MKSEKYTRYGSDKTMGLQGLQEQLKALESERERISQQGLDTSFQDATIRDVKQHITELQNRQQEHEGRIQEATAESSSFLGDIDIAGVPIAESGLSELAFNILNAKVQAKHVAAVSKLSLAMNEQQTDFQIALKAALDQARNSEYTAEQLNILNNEQGVKIYQLELENTELDMKARKGAELHFEATETIEKLNKQIDEYKKAELLAPQPTITLSTSEQVAKQEAELKASRIKVTSMVVDAEDFAKRTWYVTDALTGETKAINYLEKGNYTVVSESEAEQYRADEANKKAEQDALQAAIPTLGTPDIDYVNAVTETDEAAEIQPFPDQVQAIDNGADQTADRNATQDTLVEQSTEESEVEGDSNYPKAQGVYVATKEQYEKLRAEVNAIKAHIGLVA